MTLRLGGTRAGEIGDTWLYGVASDPAKVADYRSVLRLRTACLASGECSEQARPHMAGCCSAPG
jgi:hypothetical protein